MTQDTPPRSKTGERLRLGELAVQKGYCTQEQVDEALRIQQELGQRGGPPPLLGILMVRNGFLSTGQLIALLRTYEDQHGGAQG